MSESPAEKVRRLRREHDQGVGGGGGGGKKKGKKGTHLTPKKFGDEFGKPYGVGQDYLAPGFRPGPHAGEGPLAGYGPAADYARTKTLTEPRYYTGAATEVFGSMGTQDLREVQVALWRLGWLPEEHVTGAFDKATGTAVAQMLAGANATGQGWKRWLREKMDYLDQNGIDTLASSASDAQRALTIKLTNPDQIRSDVGTASTALLGGNYAGDPNHYVQEIQGQERTQQTQTYWQEGGPKGSDGPGGTTYDPASVGALIKKEHPLDYSVEQLGQNAQALIGLLGQRSGESRG